MYSPFITVLTIPLCPILSQMSPADIVICYVFKMHLNIIVSFTPQCPNWPVPSIRQTNILFDFSIYTLSPAYPEWRRLHNGQLHGFYSSPTIIRVTKSRSMKWVRHVARMGDRRGVYGILHGSACWITHRLCNIYCFSTATMVPRTRLSVMLYAHCCLLTKESRLKRRAFGLSFDGIMFSTSFRENRSTGSK
jgi:hypothetical protein